MDLLLDALLLGSGASSDAPGSAFPRLVADLAAIEARSSVPLSLSIWGDAETFAGFTLSSSLTLVALSLASIIP